MPKGGDKTEKNSDERLLIVQATIESNRQDSDEKMKKLTEDLKGRITSMMDKIAIPESSPDHKDSPKVQYPTTVVPANRRDPPFDGGHSTKFVTCGLSNMRSAHQHSMNSSSKHNSKSTLLWNSRTYTTTSIFFQCGD